MGGGLFDLPVVERGAVGRACRGTGAETCCDVESVDGHAL